MMDKKQRAWMLEVNANPSMNMYVDRELPNGDLERVLSDVDRFIKGTVVSDAIKVVKNKEMVDMDVRRVMAAVSFAGTTSISTA